MPLARLQVVSNRIVRGPRVGLAHLRGRPGSRHPPCRGGLHGRGSRWEASTGRGGVVERLPWPTQDTSCGKGLGVSLEAAGTYPTRDAAEAGDATRPGMRRDPDVTGSGSGLDSEASDLGLRSVRLMFKDRTIRPGND